MKLFVLFVFFTGIILVLTNEFMHDRPTRVEYRYLPRDLDDYVRTAPLPTNVFGPMFEDPDMRRAKV